jgi:hypothetical protein
MSDLGYALFEIADLARAAEVLRSARDAARRVGDRGIEWGVQVKRQHVRMYTEPQRIDPEDLEREALLAAETLGELGDHHGVSRAWIMIAELGWWRGNVTQCEDASQRAAEHARLSGSRREEAWCLGSHGFCLIQGTTAVADGRARMEGLIGAAASNPFMEANLLGFLSVLEAMAGPPEAAWERMGRSLAMTCDLGLRWQEAIHRTLKAEIHLLASDPAGAEAELRIARDAFIECGDRWFLSTTVVDLTRAAYESGDHESAAQLAEAIDESPMEHDLEWQIKRREAIAPLLATRGRPARIRPRSWPRRRSRLPTQASS